MNISINSNHKKYKQYIKYINNLNIYKQHINKTCYEVYMQRSNILLFYFMFTNLNMFPKHVKIFISVKPKQKQ